MTLLKCFPKSVDQKLGWGSKSIEVVDSNEVQGEGQLEERLFQVKGKKHCLKKSNREADIDRNCPTVNFIMGFTEKSPLSKVELFLTESQDCPKILN